MSCDITVIENCIGVEVIENNTTVEISLSKFFPTVPNIVGSDVTPFTITASGGIPFSGIAYDNYFFIKAVSPIIVTALLQIAPPSFAGQRLTVFTFDDTNTIRLKAGNGFSYNGLSMNGDWLGGLGSSITFVSSKALIWREIGRV